MRDAARWYLYACADFYLEFADKTIYLDVLIFRDDCFQLFKVQE
jgi:hypothetical protein